MHRLFRQYIQPGMSVLEVGCAPAAQLAWVGKALHAHVSGLDYSRPGITKAQQMMQAVGVQADLRCESLEETTFDQASFDVTYSTGLIEHFSNPAPMVRKHVELLRPGGVAIIMIPNFGGLYGRMQRLLDCDLLNLHNLQIMSPEALRALTPVDLAEEVIAQPYGRMGLWSVYCPHRVVFLGLMMLGRMTSLLSWLQWRDIHPLCTMLVLIIRRRG